MLAHLLYVTSFKKVGFCRQQISRFRYPFLPLTLFGVFFGIIDFMGVSRKNDPRYVLGKNKRGHNAWLRRDDVAALTKLKGNIGALVDMSNGNGRPRPSKELLRAIDTLPDLSGWDFSGLDLSGVLFEGKWLNGTRFTDADLTGAVFKQVSADEIDLTGAVLAGTSMEDNVRLDNIVYGDTFDLSGVLVEKTSLFFAKPTRLTGFRDGSFRRPGLLEYGFHLGNVSFEGEKFSGMDFDGLATLEDANFTGAVFEENTILDSVSFYTCVFDNVIAREVSFHDVTFLYCDIKNSDFFDAEFYKSNFFYTKFRNVNISGWHSADGSDEWSGCSFLDVDMDPSADLTGWEDDMLNRLY